MQKKYQKGILFLSLLFLLILVLYTAVKIRQTGISITESPQTTRAKYDNESSPDTSVIEVEPVIEEANHIEQFKKSQFTESSTSTNPIQPEKKQQITEREKEELVVKAVFKALNKNMRYQDANESDLRAAQSIAMDSSKSLKERRSAAWDLATMGDAEAIEALQELLVNPETPASLKAAILEGLGYSSETQAKELLLAGINDEDQSVARAGIRGLGILGDADSISILSDILYSSDASDSIVQEAATALGGIEKPEARDVLIDAYSDAQIARRETLREDIITSLGQRDISETADFFQQIMDEYPHGDPMRVAVVEAVENAQGDKSAFILNNLNDPDSDVRAAAAWALAVDEEPPQVDDVLSDMLTAEQNAEVRKRIYQVLENQQTLDIEPLTGIILAEPDPDARLAGYDLLAQQLQNSENAEFAKQFELVVPQLCQTALTAKQLNQRLSAVMTLKRAQTGQSDLALEQIAAESSDKRVLKAVGM